MKYSFCNGNSDVASSCREAISAGFDYTELTASQIMSLDDGAFESLANESESLCIYAVRDLIPDELPLVGEGIDYNNYPAITAYLTKLIDRLVRLGVKLAVLGSGKARSITDGTSIFTAYGQIEAFVRLFAEIADGRIALLLDSLDKAETNVLNSIADTAEIAREFSADKVGVSAYSCVMNAEGEQVETLHKIKDELRLVRIDETDDYSRHFVGALVACGYDGVVSVDGLSLDCAKSLFEGEVETVVKLELKRDMHEEPMHAGVLEGRIPDDLTALCTADGRSFPAQKNGDGIIAIVTGRKGEKLMLSPDNGDSFIPVKLEQGKDKLTVRINGEYFADYVYSTDFMKPFLGPIVDGDGNRFTRLDFETKEHPHHHSVFIGIGDVNGANVWSETSDCGKVVTKEIRNAVSGTAFGSFDAVTVWQDKDGCPIIDETTTYTVYAQHDGCRYLDIRLVFMASYGDVTFGKTKEGGPLAIRVNEELREDKGTGRITSAYGGVGEAECWSKATNWVDYSGTVTGKDGQKVDMGATVFDNEENERYPTGWHVRSYGLFAANNNGFKGESKIKSGETREYNFRIVFHRSAFDRTETENRFVNYMRFGKI